MSLDKVHARLRCSTLDGLHDLDAWLHDEIAARHVQEVAVRCGKPPCRCASGATHGPYWYAYWSEDGKTRCRYVGKRLSSNG